MSHERGSVPAPERGPTPAVEPRGLLGRLRAHFTSWPERYVEMRVGKRLP